MWGRGLRGSNGACSTPFRFSVTPSITHNQIGPFWCFFPSGWVCVRFRTLWVSSVNSPVRLGVSPAAASNPQVFSISGVKLNFPLLELWVVQSVTPSTSCCLSGQLQLCLARSTICHLAGSASHRLAASPLHPTACLRPSYRLDECFFFISLVVGLPYSSIFCQFWLFFVFKLLLSFFWLCEEAQCVYLYLHLVWKSLLLSCDTFRNICD